MRQLFARLAVLSVALAATATLASAQTRPTPDEARVLLQTRPDLVAQLRDRMGSSGMTPEQIRARLRAEGYPEDMLDAYMPGSTMTPSAPPDESTFDAIRALGVTDPAGMDSLRSLALGPTESAPARPVAPPQEVVCDSAPALGASPLDSLGLLDDSTRTETTAADSAGARADARQRRGARLVCRAYPIFGLDMFARRTTQFDASLAGPVSESYRLGPGDRLVLVLTGDVEAARTLDVTREGFIVIPQVGQLYVANLTLGELESLLYQRLSRVYSGIGRGPGATTHFSISVARLRVNQVFVVGDVVRPGSYRVSSVGTALTALYAAGGPTQNGSLRRIEIRRGGRVVDVLDVYDYLLHGDASHDARLESGDVVFVPVHGPRVRVEGEVVRPAVYELRESETLADAIQAAGGYTPGASRERVQIERILPPAQRGPAGRDRVVMDVTTGSGAAVDATRVGSGAAGVAGAAGGGELGATVAMMPGDVVHVFPVARRVRNRISVAGSVWSPGPQGFTPGMRLSQAIQRAGGLKPDVYLGQVLITRLQSDSTRVQLRSSFRDTTGTPASDLALQEDDEIRVFSTTDFRPRRYVSINGAVRKSGRVSYREGMTVRDLVLLAGGLEESAYLGDAEIARLPENRAGGATAVTVRVPLDSSYLFERGPDGKYLGPPGLPAASGPAPEVLLRPYDNVLILRQPEWQLQRTVAVAGEVKFPGHYSLVNKKERLADVIRRAGGVTASAYPGGVTFYRQGERIGIDLPRVLADGRFRDNLMLQDGDSIVIPAYNGVVEVRGAVNAPTAVAFMPGGDVDDYVRAAGGESRKADMKRAYVTQPNGKVESVRRRVLLPDGVPNPGPGSVVYVPEKNPDDKSNLGQNLTVIASIMGSLVAVVAILRR